MQTFFNLGIANFERLCYNAFRNKVSASPSGVTFEPHLLYGIARPYSTAMSGLIISVEDSTVRQHSTHPAYTAGFKGHCEARRDTKNDLVLRPFFCTLRPLHNFLVPIQQKRLSSRSFYAIMQRLTKNMVFALMVKRSRRRPLTAESRVRFPMGVPQSTTNPISLRWDLLLSMAGGHLCPNRYRQ